MKQTKILFLLLLLVTVGVKAQQVTRMRINEVLVDNRDNYVDDYGQRVPWIELFNSSYNVVNIEGCFLSNDINNPKMYRIPKGDVLTKVEARQHVLFYADNRSSRGTFHLNFTLDLERENTIYLFDSNGTTLIDCVTVPVLDANVSWGRVMDGENVWGKLSKVTPSTNNKTLDSNEKVDGFAEKDGNGTGMSLTAMSVVFLVLIFLAVFFKIFTTVSIRLAARRAARITGVDVKKLSKEEVSGEVYAAISITLHELNKTEHDIENTVLTIARTRRSYSPWSSKIYGLRQILNKK